MYVERAYTRPFRFTCRAVVANTSRQPLAVERDQWASTTPIHKSRRFRGDMGGEGGAQALCDSPLNSDRSAALVIRLCARSPSREPVCPDRVIFSPKLDDVFRVSLRLITRTCSLSITK